MKRVKVLIRETFDVPGLKRFERGTEHLISEKSAGLFEERGLVKLVRESKYKIPASNETKVKKINNK